MAHDPEFARAIVRLKGLQLPPGVYSEILITTRDGASNVRFAVRAANGDGFVFEVIEPPSDEGLAWLRKQADQIAGIPPTGGQGSRGQSANIGGVVVTAPGLGFDC